MEPSPSDCTAELCLKITKNVKLLLLIPIFVGASHLLFSANSDPWPTSGYVGIGTDDPDRHLHIYEGGTGWPEFLIESSYTSSALGRMWGLVSNPNTGELFFRSLNSDFTANNTVLRMRPDGKLGVGGIHTTRQFSVYEPVGSGISMFKATYGTYDFIQTQFKFESTITNGASHVYLKDQDNNDSRYLIEGLGGGGSVDAFYVSSSGKAGIGIEPSGTYRLEVNGTIRAKEIIVESTGWSDFVFDEDYQLRSLEEVAVFIDDNGHLPDMPSAADVDERGVTLGEMNSRLLQKVEELTLYMLQQNRRIENLEQKNADLNRLIKN